MSKDHFKCSHTDYWLVIMWHLCAVWLWNISQLTLALGTTHLMARDSLSWCFSFFYISISTPTGFPVKATKWYEPHGTTTRDHGSHFSEVQACHMFGMIYAIASDLLSWTFNEVQHIHPNNQMWIQTQKHTSRGVYGKCNSALMFEWSLDSALRCCLFLSCGKRPCAFLAGNETHQAWTKRTWDGEVRRRLLLLLTLCLLGCVLGTNIFLPATTW